MKQKQFTLEQIVAVLKQAEAGVPLAELLRRVGVSEHMFYRWKRQYVGHNSRSSFNFGSWISDFDNLDSYRRLAQLQSSGP